MNTFINTVLGVCVALVFIVLFVACATIGLDRQARSQCDTWEMESLGTPGYTITQSQKDQCDFYHVSINAPVR